MKDRDDKRKKFYDKWGHLFGRPEEKKDKKLDVFLYLNVHTIENKIIIEPICMN